MLVTKRVKSDFQLIESFGCNFYCVEYRIKSGPDSDPNDKKKCGGHRTGLTIDRACEEVERSFTA